MAASGIRSCVTICLVDEASNGPFVFHGDFDGSCAKAAEIGFDAVELFAPGPNTISTDQVMKSVEKHGLELTAVGTGAGKILHGFTISNIDDTQRSAAVDYARSMVDFGAEMGVPAIVGSMQGNADTPGDTVGAARWRLTMSLASLGSHAESQGVPLLFEPLNRYESNLSNELEDAVRLIETEPCTNVKILADLFHMNIEETDMAAAIRSAGNNIGHVHFADSNRQAVGFGHSDMQSVADALKEIGFTGYASAEVFAKPDSVTAAEQTKKAFDTYFG